MTGPVSGISLLPKKCSHTGYNKFAEHSAESCASEVETLTQLLDVWLKAYDMAASMRPYANRAWFRASRGTSGADARPATDRQAHVLPSEGFPAHRDTLHNFARNFLAAICIAATVIWRRD